MTMMRDPTGYISNETVADLHTGMSTNESMNQSSIAHAIIGKAFEKCMTQNKNMGCVVHERERLIPLAGTYVYGTSQPCKYDTRQTSDSGCDKLRVAVSVTRGRHSFTHSFTHPVGIGVAGSGYLLHPSHAATVRRVEVEHPDAVGCRRHRRCQAQLK